MGVSRILYDFSQWTSAHGVPHIGAANNKVLRVFWVLVTLTCISVFIWQLVELVNKYTEYDVTVQTELKFEERDFPSVTFCNMNPYRYPVIQQLAGAAEANANIVAIRDELETYNSNEDAATDNQKRSVTIDAVSALASELPDNLWRDITYDRNDSRFTAGLLTSCAYNAKACHWDNDFAEFVDQAYGRCYTFNSGQMTDPYKSTRAGPLYGLRLLTVSNQAEYMPTTDSVGTRVVVHSQDEHPFIDSFGLNAAAGFTTSFGVKFVKMERLGSPHGDCLKDTSGLGFYYGDSYTIEGCFRSCVQKTIIDKCQCGSSKYNSPNGTVPCLTTNAADQDCIKSVTEGAAGKALVDKCACPQPCMESTFSVTVSTALWPSEAYTPPECKAPATVANEIGYPWVPEDFDYTSDTADNEMRESCVQWYRENTMLIEVYYERMNYQLLQESAAYTLVNLISDMGGQLGLWLGISVITIIEVCSLLILLGMYCFGKKRKKKDEDDQPNPFDGKEKAKE